mgnify:CR=1 FL=1
MGELRLLERVLILDICANFCKLIWFNIIISLSYDLLSKREVSSYEIPSFANELYQTYCMFRNMNLFSFIVSNSNNFCKSNSKATLKPQYRTVK